MIALKTVLFSCLVFAGQAYGQYNKDYLKKAWIVKRTVVNDSLDHTMPCTVFFGQGGQYGTFCPEANEWSVLANWEIKGDTLTVREKTGAVLYHIAGKTAVAMQLERVTGQGRLTLYCQWHE